MDITRGQWTRLKAQLGRITRRDDCEDLLQGAYVGMLEQTSPIANPEGFLVRAAINRGHDEYRRSRTRAETANGDLTLQFLADPYPLQDEFHIMRQRLAHARSGIDRLSPRTREVFVLHRLEGLRYREIAEKLGISQSSVEKHIAKAARELADWMSGW